MQQAFELTSVAGAVLVVLTLVSGIKAGWPAWTEGKEARLSLALGLLVAVAAKLTHAMFPDPGVVGWVQTVVGGLAIGIGAQLAHDKALNAMKARKTDPPAAGDSK